MRLLNKISKKIKWPSLKDRLWWILGFARRYWKEMVLYVLLGLSGTALTFISALVSKNLVDIVTGHDTGQVVSTFITMICMTLATTLIGQISSYFSTMVSLKVENNIKAQIFEKIMVSDWEELSRFRTGDLLVRWSGDSSSLASACVLPAANV